AEVDAAAAADPEAQAEAGARDDAQAAPDSAAQVDANAPASTDVGVPPPALPAPTPGAWLETFRKDMRSVLLAELDVRLQPVEGLLATLRTS
ncbi:DUF3348 family protein, partial [Achromobacter sp.]